MKVPGCVLDIEDASSADLRESSRLKSQKTLQAGRCTEAYKLKLANT